MTFLFLNTYFSISQSYIDFVNCFLNTTYSYLCVCLLVFMCSTYGQCPQGPEEVLGPPIVGVTMFARPFFSICVLITKPRSSARAESILFSILGENYFLLKVKKHMLSGYTERNPPTRQRKGRVEPFLEG